MSTHERLAELKDQLEARTRVMHDVAHELKNPMAVIHGYAAYLAEHDDLTPAERRKALRTLMTNAERVIALIDQLQESARLESAGLEVSPARTTRPRSCRKPPNPPSSRPRAAASSCAGPARSRAASSCAPIPSARPAAIQPRRQRAEVRPTGGVVELGVQPEDDFVRFTVADTGPGVPAADLPRLFDRFYQACGKEQGAGPRPGLAICKTLVETHGGRIWAESLPGAGAPSTSRSRAAPLAAR